MRLATSIQVIPLNREKRKTPASLNLRLFIYIYSYLLGTPSQGLAEAHKIYRLRFALLDPPFQKPLQYRGEQSNLQSVGSRTAKSNQ